MTTTCCNTVSINEHGSRASARSTGNSLWRRLKAQARRLSSDAVAGPAVRLHGYRYLSSVSVDRVLEELDRRTPE